MANVRGLNKEKFQISNYRFRELYYFCLQYEEWQEQLKDKRNPLKATQISGMPSSGNPGNPTESAAIACAELSAKCRLVEQAAKAADPELWEYIIFAVTHENITFNFLKVQKDFPYERDRYYNSRRKFYFLLDKYMSNRKERGIFNEN